MSKTEEVITNAMIRDKEEELRHLKSKKEKQDKEFDKIQQMKLMQVFQKAFADKVICIEYTERNQGFQKVEFRDAAVFETLLVMDIATLRIKDGVSDVFDIPISDIDQVYVLDCDWNIRG